jgi:hypothetical protein
VFKVCLSLILTICLTNINRVVMKALKLVEPPERVDGKTPEAYQLSTRHSIPCWNLHMVTCRIGISQARNWGRSKLQVTAM